MQLSCNPYCTHFNLFCSTCVFPNFPPKLVQAFLDLPLLSSDAQSSVYFADGYRALWSNGQAMLWNKQQRRLALTAMFMLWVIWLVQYRSEQLGLFSWPHVLAIKMWFVPGGLWAAEWHRNTSFCEWGTLKEKEEINHVVSTIINVLWWLYC